MEVALLGSDCTENTVEKLDNTSKEAVQTALVLKAGVEADTNYQVAEEEAQTGAVEEPDSSMQ